MDTNNNQSYKSGSDYVLEYGELCFSFNEQDFTERIEEAAIKLGFIATQLEQDELTDLLCLVVNGEIFAPASSLGEHVNDNWMNLGGPDKSSLVHWLRRLVFRGAWLDNQVKAGELEVVFNDQHNQFEYVQKQNGAKVIELNSDRSWSKLAYKSC